jgi:hypothetical protein
MNETTPKQRATGLKYCLGDVSRRAVIDGCNERVRVLTTALLLLAGIGAALAETAQRHPAHKLLTQLSAEEQIELATGAAPAPIARHATIMVLTPTGYITARSGTNGFTCLVERQLPETLEPSCYDAEGSATTLKARLFREELRLANVPKDEIERRLDENYQTGKLLAPRRPGLVYMLSRSNWVWNDRTQTIIHAPPHVMFYAPYATAKDVGGFLGPQYPYVVLEGRPDAYIIMIPAADTGTSHSHGK